MRKITIIAILVIICVPAIFLAYYQYNNRLFLLEAGVLSDQTKFNEMEFRNGSAATRASMAVEIIRSKKYIGERCDSIPKLLGDRTGDYYHSDSNSTYKLSEEKSASWILTFICGENGVIEDVIIRKIAVRSRKSYFAGDSMRPLIKL